MRSDTPLDYAVFQLSPKRTRCELFVSNEGKNEKLASGLLKPFVTHVTVVEEQVAQALQSIKLEVERRKNVGTWFTKGTLERFVRFVSTPQVLEMVNTFDAEMTQLESARRIYSLGIGGHDSGALGESEAAMEAADTTKKELLKAIDVRIMAVMQDLTAACARASAAGFTLDSVSELLLFADRFGAHRLNEACSKFISLCQRRPELINSSGNGIEDRNIRMSSGSDMSLDDDTAEDYNNASMKPDGPKQEVNQHDKHVSQDIISSGSPTRFADSKANGSSSFGFVLRRSSSLASCDRIQLREKDKMTEKDEENVMDQTSSLGQQPGRRLSVQDRINMFENKQKQESGSGGRVNTGKPVELRRLSSDVGSSSAAAEKAVLRRWSGTSDMSIDIDDKKETEPLDCGPPTSSTSQIPVSSNPTLFKGDGGGFRDAGTSFIPLRDSSPGNQVVLQDKFRGLLKDKNQSSRSMQLKDFSSLEERVSSKDHAASLTQFRAKPGGQAHVKVKDQVASETQPKGFHCGAVGPSLKDHLSSQTQYTKAFECLVDDAAGKVIESSAQLSSVTFPNRVKSGSLTDQLASNDSFGGNSQEVELHLKDLACSQFKSSSSKREGFAQREHPSSQIEQRESTMKVEEVGNSSLVVPPQQKSCPPKEGESGKRDLASQAPSGHSSSIALEGSGHRGMKLHKRNSDYKQSNAVGLSQNQNIGSTFAGKVTESMEMFDSAAMASQGVQKARPSKGNQELNEELQLKADELEKLFAAHKLRIPGDQASSSRRGKVIDQQVKQVPALFESKSGASTSHSSDFQCIQEPLSGSANGETFDLSLLMKMVSHQVLSDPKQKPSEFGLSEDSRGIFYDRYMQKREAKLKEEWATKRVQKEAKMKAMQDSLERSKAELKAKFDKPVKSSALRDRCRVEKLRSFNSHAMKSKDQQVEEFSLSEEDEDQPGLSEENPFFDGSSKSTNAIKFLQTRSTSSGTPRISVTPPQLSVRTINSGSGRRRGLPDISLAQSVPNFSDFRKENTKPSAGMNKSSSRSQYRSNIRSKSTSEDINLVKEEKSQRSQSMRKSSVDPFELIDASPIISDNSVLTSMRFLKERTEQSLQSKIPKNGESKPFFRKTNGMAHGSGVSIAKLKTSSAPQVVAEVENEDLGDQLEDPASFVEVDEEDEEDFEKVTNEEAAENDDFYAGYADEKPSLSHGSEKYGNPESENGEVLRSFSQADDDSSAATPVTISSNFCKSMEPVQDSPGESPASWMRHSFSYPHETSDIDASVDSPIGSPASWNAHALTQIIEADAARMRKKWGSAQKPVLVGNASSHQSRKDVTRGFKRLLKFGRKNRGPESLISDWVSASTASEGDDDTEDGRDPVNRGSEDLRKSRMGFIQGNPYDGFGEADLFNGQASSLSSSISAPPANFKSREDHLSGGSLKVSAPRSFFSLTSFRSKGSESKPR